MRPFYPSFLTEALRHAERLTGVLESLDPSRRGPAAAKWLLGRASEVDCVVQLVISDWSAGQRSEVHAAQALNGYVSVLHRGLALHFGELAPPCCISSLVITASPASYDSPTSVFPRILEPSWATSNVTWHEVEDADIVSITHGPNSVRR
jgi:hypothetical protein